MINSVFYKYDSVWRKNNEWPYKEPDDNKPWRLIDIPSLDVQVYSRRMGRLL